MDKICLIKQPAGLGDIFFLQKIAYEISLQGYHIFWPLQDNFLYLTQYIRQPYITFFSELEDFPYKDIYQNEFNIINNDDFLYLPLQYADRYVRGESMMEVKYKWIDKDFKDWVSFFNFKRNYERENILFNNILDLKDNEDYILVNKNFGSPPHYKTITNIDYPTDIRIVEMDFYGLDILFDWCKVIENAKEIYTVETSICYLIEKLNCKAKDIHLYSRDRDPNFNYIKNILTKKYKYYEGKCI